MREPTAFSQWSADDYLREYYSRVEVEEELTIEFLVRQCARIPARSVVLEFGSGPTIHHALPLSRRAAEIHVADLLPSNLEAIRRWQVAHPRAHDWSEFTRYVLRHEGIEQPTHADVQSRETLTREVITRRFLADARHALPLGLHGRRYQCVVTCYCADSATADKLEWRRYMRNIANLVAPGGRLVVAALRNCTSYLVGGHRFPSACIDERDLANIYEELRLSEVTIEIASVPERAEFGFSSILLSSARRATYAGAQLTPTPASTRSALASVAVPGECP